MLLHKARHIGARDLIKHLAVADDGMTQRMLTKRGAEDEMLERVAGIIVAHGHLAADDVHLARELIAIEL